MEWLRTKASAWWGESTRAYTFALAFVCAHRDQATFDRLQSRPWASLRCFSWTLKIKASEESLRRAALSLMPPPDDSLRWFADPDEPMDWSSAPDLASLAQRLSKACGGTPEHWLWEVADADFWAAVCDLRDDADDEAHAASIAAGNGHADGTWWKRHRQSLKRCEDALERDMAAWKAKRNEKPEPAKPEAEALHG
jgi:hypothetical protein